MATGKFISYLRVSTDKQGKSGLGLEAQREAVDRYLNGGRWTLVKEYVEVESGKDSARPKLAAALAHAKAIKARLVVAKMDRLSRNVAFIAALMESGVKFVAADNPEANELTIHILSAVAQHERKAISERTKAALAVARKRIARQGQRGHPNIKRLGNPYGARALKDKQTGNKQAIAAIRAQADEFARNLSDIIEDIRNTGITSTRMIAEELNSRGIPTARGGRWMQTSVVNLLARLS
jgi:DNA invertase Pin-like site-specific DNA recombinase